MLLLFFKRRGGPPPPCSAPAKSPGLVPPVSNCAGPGATWKRYDPGLCSLHISVRAAVLTQGYTPSGLQKSQSVLILYLMNILLTSNNL